jgi:hypothetical protein
MLTGRGEKSVMSQDVVVGFFVFVWGWTEVVDIVLI